MLDRTSRSRIVTDALRWNARGAVRDLARYEGRWAREGAPPIVAELLLHRDPIHVEALLTLLAGWLRRETPATIAVADRAWREHLPALRVEETDSLRAFVEDPNGWSIAAVLASHRDGYVRERMVRWLGEHRGGEEIPYLILRANDWVEPVRRLARDLLHARLAVENADAVIASIGAWSLLGRFRRAGQDELLAALRAFLRRPDVAAARERGLGSSDRGVRRALGPVVLEAEPPDRAAELVQRFARDDDIALRRLALRAMERDERLRTEPAIERLLLDADLALRQGAQHIARGRGANLRAFYRRALERDEVDPCAALFGLGETGAADDAELVRGHLDDPRTRVRRAALLALAWLAPDASADVLVDALEDSRRRVSRDAARQLEHHAHLAVARRARIDLIARSSREEHIRESARSALAAADAYMRRWRAGED